MRDGGNDGVPLDDPFRPVSDTFETHRPSRRRFSVSWIEVREGEGELFIPATARALHQEIEHCTSTRLLLTRPFILNFYKALVPTQSKHININRQPVNVDCWMATRTWWTWVWVNSGSWWWTGRPGVLRFMGSQRVGHDWATELNWNVDWLLWYHHFRNTSTGMISMPITSIFVSDDDDM